MAANGVRVNGEPVAYERSAGLGVGSDGSVQGSDATVIDPVQIQLALDVVACKREVDYVRRLADGQAAEQDPVMAKYEPELTAHIQALRKDARAVIAEYEAQQ